MKSRTRIVIVATVLMLMLLGMACRKHRPRKHQSSKSNPTATAVDQVTHEMMLRDYYPVDLRNDWPDSGKIVIPGGPGGIVAVRETTVFCTSGQEAIVFCRPGRHLVKEWYKKNHQWILKEERFTVSTQRMSGYRWSRSWDNQPSYGWIRLWHCRPQGG